jgi:hypothetical protein
VFFLLSGLLCYMSLSKLDNTLVILSFMINLICITIGFTRTIATKKLQLDLVIWFFMYTFFFLAPIVQLNKGIFFPNSLPIELSSVIQANLLIFMWNIIYLMFRKRDRQVSVDRSEAPVGFNKKTILEGSDWKLKTLYFILALFIVLITFKALQFKFFFGYLDYSALTSNKSLLLLMGIGFKGIVLANWLFSFAQYRAKRSLTNMPYLLLSSIMLIYEINSFNTNRFYIGFCAILVIFAFFYEVVTPGKFILYIFLGLFVIFPFLNYFRNGFKTFELPNLYDLMFSQLTELHFDAYSNIIATLNYCEVNGFSWGYQMLGVLFFFVPRGIWLTKPLSSGETLGDFIASNHSLHMNNISDPIISEFYINFGLLGVAGGALLIAHFVNKLENTSSRFAYALFAGYVFMIYRGDLMSAFAYCFGTYIIMIFIPKITAKFMKRPSSISSGSARQMTWDNREFV